MSSAGTLNVAVDPRKDTELQCLQLYVQDNNKTTTTYVYPLPGEFPLEIGHQLMRLRMESHLCFHEVPKAFKLVIL